MSLYRVVRPLLFRLPPERAHALTLQTIGLVGRIPPLAALLEWLTSAPLQPVQVAGLSFPNPVGLAAGYDKDGVAVNGLAALGFGHIEIGTVTPQPQPGNPRPRVFRLPEDQAVINRMGFPSAGADALARRLTRLKRPRQTLLGVNIGKNKATPNEQAVFDYLTLLERFSGLADYLAVNISSPNTVGLRDLQARAELERLLGALRDQRAALETPPVPIFVKLAPDLTPAELENALDVIVGCEMDGVILTNTTVARPELRSAWRGERGGLSGAPLRGPSEQMLAQAVRWLDGRLPVISVGGIMTPDDARRRLDMGAALVQLYTGLIYYGPFLPRDCARAAVR